MAAYPPELGSNLIHRVNVADSLRRCASWFPDKVALHDAEGSVTYGDLHRQVSQIGRSLLADGLEHQDFVAILCRNSIDFMRAYFACARAGLIALPLNTSLTLKEMAQILGEARPRAIVAEDVFAAPAADLAQEIDGLDRVYLCGAAADPPGFGAAAGTTVAAFADLRRGDDADLEVVVDDRDTVQCIYTSGTTALPKGVLTSHVAATFTMVAAAMHLKLDHQDVQVVCLPLNHVGGLNNSLLPHLFVGATVVILRGWDVDDVIAAVEGHRATTTLLTAPMWTEIINHPDIERHDLTSLRVCLYAIASLPPERIEELRRICPKADIVLASGQTEFTGYEEGQRPEHQWTKPTSWGAPTAVVDVQIMDDDGNLLPPGEVGEIVYRGPQAMTEYYAHPEQTAEAFAHGWFHSGDLGWVDEENVVWFVDRKKDMVKTGGENVASIEVAHAIVAHPAVADVAVVGLPHARWSEAITAFVLRVPGSDLSERELLEHCHQRLAAFKVPKRVVFVEDFPKTASGKIQKVVLRERFADLYTGA